MSVAAEMERALMGPAPKRPRAGKRKGGAGGAAAGAEEAGDCAGGN